MEPIKILLFTSPDCSICENQEHILRRFSETGRVTYESRLITSAFDLALRFGVKSAPSLVYLFRGRPVRVRPGFQSQTAVAADLNLIQNG